MGVDVAIFVVNCQWLAVLRHELYYLRMKKIGVLDIQGSVEEHVAAVRAAGALALPVKTAADLKKIGGLILPGGESTTIGKLLRKFALREAIISHAKKGMPIYGTCAGAILLAKKIVGLQKADTLGLMDIEIERNAYGRQIDSFETSVEFDFGPAMHGKRKIPAVFIRAPKVKSVGKNVQILAKYKNEIVAARENNFLITMFHPELTDDLSVHKYFVKMC